MILLSGSNGLLGTVLKSILIRKNNLYNNRKVIVILMEIYKITPLSRKQLK